jgi:hypothetical protein
MFPLTRGMFATESALFTIYTNHFYGFLKPIFVILRSESISYDAYAFVFPQQQQAFR